MYSLDDTANAGAGGSEFDIPEHVREAGPPTESDTEFRESALYLLPLLSKGGYGDFEIA